METFVQANVLVSEVALQERRSLSMISFAEAVLPSIADCQLVLAKLSVIQRPISVHELAALVGCSDVHQETNLFFILAWLHKQGWISLTPLSFDLN
jgi:hypothetical protein